MKSQQCLDILIVGAGISGLTNALALHHQGFKRIRLLEQAESLGEVGAGIQLAPNAVRALYALGLQKPLDACADSAPYGQMRAGESNHFLGKLPLSDYSEKAYGLPSYQILRTDLHRLLLDAVENAGIPIQLGKRVSGYRSASDGAELQLASGEALRADLLIAANGLASTLADQMHPRYPVFFSGYACWRALVDAAEAEKIFAEQLLGKLTVWSGSGKHMVAYPVGNTSMLNLVAVHERTDWNTSSRSLESSVSAWLKAYADWHTDIQELIGLADKPQLWGLFERPKLPHWYQDRCLLVGDAAHPMLPSLAQGAAQGIEDALLLANILANTQDLDAVGKKFYALRHERVARVQDSAHWNAQYFHQPDSLFRRCRNLAMRGAGPIATGLIARRYDWLYRESI